MTLQATFSLTPRGPFYYVSPSQYAQLYIFGADFLTAYSHSFNGQYAENKLHFDDGFAADSTLDYSIWQKRRKSRHVQLRYNLSSLGTNKELALIFSFEVTYSSPRLLICTDNGLLSDVTLVQGDNQFLMEVESLDYLNLYFIHATKAGSSYGGSWFFTGINGYVV